MSRFVRCSAFLSTLTQPKTKIDSIGYLLGVIRTVQVPFGAEDTSGIVSVDTWATRWVSAIDVKNLVYYFNSTSTSNIVWVDFKNLNFSKYEPVKSVTLQNVSFVGDISNFLK